MTSESTRHLIENFLGGISGGHVPDELLTPDMTFWSISSGEAEQARFQGAIYVLAQIANHSMRYNIVSLTAEEDRVVAEVKSNATLVNGEEFHNDHVFLFRLRDGKIGWAGEYMNQFQVREKLLPLMQAAMEKAGK